MMAIKKFKARLIQFNHLNELYKTITWDRGSEMTNHKDFTLATDIQI